MGLFSSNKSTTVNETTQNFFDQRSVVDAGGGVVGSGNFVDASADETWSYSDSSTRNWLDASSSYVDGSSRYNYADNSLRFTDASSRTSNSTAYSTADNSLRFTDASSRTSSSYLDASDRSVFTQSVSDDRDVWWTDASNRAITDASNRAITDASNRSTTTINAVDPGLVRLGELNAGFLGAAAESQSDTVRFMTDASLGSLRYMGGAAGDLFATSAANSARAWESTLDASSALVARVLDGSMSTVKQTQALAGSALAQYQPAESKSADSLKWVVGLAVAGLVLATWARKG
jgi:hypothetical protein